MSLINKLPYELLIGLRYTRAKRKNHFISFISLTSMIGIALGVAALIVVLSVMNGFQAELRTRILGVASHLEITGANNQLGDWVMAARYATEGNIKIGIKGDKNSSAMYVKEVIKRLTERDIHRFILITSLAEGGEAATETPPATN